MKKIAMFLMIITVTTVMFGAKQCIWAEDSLGSIVCIGDSITEGNALRPAGDGNWSWRYAFWKKLVDLGVSHKFVGTRTSNHYGSSVYPDYNGHVFTNRHEAIWGQTAEERAASSTNYLAEILATNGAPPDTAIIFLGGNDIPLDLSVSAETVRDRIKVIIDNCQGDLGESGNPAIRILLISILPRFVGSNLDTPDVRNGRFEEINTLLRTLATNETTASSKVTFLDMVPAFSSPPGLLWDGTHPNGIGEPIIGKAVCDEFFPPPGIATDPVPANGTNYVDWNPVLSWTAGSNTTFNKVYAGLTTEVTLLTNQTETTYSMGLLDTYTPYYWRIDEVNDYGTTTGTLWHFTTMPPPNITNVPPYMESFEEYDVGTQLGWSNGWYGASWSSAIVVSNETINDSFSGEYPIDTNHTRYLSLKYNITNRLATGTNSIISLDTLVWVKYCYGKPVMYSNLQAAIQFNKNGHPQLWNRDVAGSSNRWTTFEQVTVSTGDWARIQFTLDYKTLDTINNAHYYQAKVNGCLLTNSFGLTDNNGTGAPGGGWFAMAVSSPGSRLSSAVFVTSKVDDLVINSGNIPPEIKGALLLIR